MAKRRDVDLVLAVADGADLNVSFAAQAGEEQAIRVANRQLGEVNAGLRCRIARAPAVPGQSGHSSTYL